jgi:hypothetical protein
MSLEYVVKPIDRWPGKRRHGTEQKFSPFRRTKEVQSSFGGGTYRTSERGAPWSRIVKELERELRHLNATDVVLRMDVEARHIRSDGQLRADARPASSAIMLQFQARNIDGWPRLIYKCDVFRDWQSNLYAIAKSLEALRLVDRYEVTTAGEQYAGFKQIGATSTTTITAEAAAKIVSDTAGYRQDLILSDRSHAKEAVRRAISFTHPDRNNGDRTAYDRVDAARAVLSSHHGISL